MKQRSRDTRLEKCSSLEREYRYVKLKKIVPIPQLGQQIDPSKQKKPSMARQLILG